MQKMLGNGIQEKGKILGLAQIYLFLMEKLNKNKKILAQKGVYYWFEGLKV